MGWLKRLTAAMKDPHNGPVGSAPSPEFPSPIDLMLAAVARLDAAGEGHWIDLNLFDSAGRGLIGFQLAGRVVNLTFEHEARDVPQTLRAHALADLAERAAPEGEGLWRFVDASPADIVSVLDALAQDITGTPAYGLSVSVDG